MDLDKKRVEEYIETGRNPLKSGQCFLHLKEKIKEAIEFEEEGRNPLKSGQCFLRILTSAMML